MSKNQQKQYAVKDQNLANIALYRTRINSLVQYTNVYCMYATAMQICIGIGMYVYASIDPNTLKLLTVEYLSITNACWNKKKLCIYIYIRSFVKYGRSYLRFLQNFMPHTTLI